MMSAAAGPLDVSSCDSIIPFNQNGDVDWNTLGNILTAHMLGEVVCVSYVDRNYGHSKEEEFKTDTDWQFAYESNGIVVFQKLPSDPKFFQFLSRGVIKAPVIKVAELLRKVESSLIWDKFLVEAKHFKVLSQSETHCDFIAYHRYEAAQCFASRKGDALFYKRYAIIGGKCVITGMSVDDPDYPPLPGIKRGKLGCGSGFVLEPYHEDNTLVTYMGKMNIKGIPLVLVKQAFRFHPMGIQRIQKHFRRLERERAKAEEKEASVVPMGLLKTAQSRSVCPSRYYEDAIPISFYTQSNSKTTTAQVKPDNPIIAAGTHHTPTQPIPAAAPDFPSSSTSDSEGDSDDDDSRPLPRSLTANFLEDGQAMDPGSSSDRVYSCSSSLDFENTDEANPQCHVDIAVGDGNSDDDGTTAKLLGDVGTEVSTNK